jgi:DNA-binding SARP family transcriptional activator
MAAGMQFCLLGPLVVRCGEVVVLIPPGKQRALLAALLLNPGRVVSVDELAETLWGAGPPPSARVTVQNYVKRLRNSLADTGHSRIATQPGGYMICVDDGELDVSRFEMLLGSARAAARRGLWDKAARQARAALSLWRGEPLADVGSDTLTSREVPRLAEMRLQALETRLDADLNLGRHADVIAELRCLAATHPLREHLHAQLMLALYRDDRQAEALTAYQHARQVLIEELGTEPGAGLRELHQQMLTADPALAAPETGRASAGAGARVVPRQLPPAVAHFVGRAAELEALSGMLDGTAPAPGTVVITAIGGTAGVGKTVLAVHWAHQLSERFPDGQLYVNLRGFDPSGTPAAPAEPICDFLDALGVPAGRVPPGLAARAALYRTQLAAKRMLIVLDNARDAAQVRPLLPGSPGCLVIVTSRNQLTGLAASDSARLLALDLLTEADARQLLAARLGSDRINAEPEAAAEVAVLCARLPLALAAAAARAAARPRLPLAALAAELRDAQNRLDALDSGDPATSVRAVFSWSTQQLTDSAARMFRLLGLHPGPDITAAAAASLAGTSVAQASRGLAELARAHLVAEHTSGRYAQHDLLRAYATEQTRIHDSDTDRHAATQRILDHYLHTAHAAALQINPLLELSPLPAPVTLTPPRPGVTPEHLAGEQRARTWFEAEYRVLLAAARLAAAAGFDICAWQLPWTMADFSDSRGHWDEQAAIELAGLAAATRLGDRAGQVEIRLLLTWSCAKRGHYDRARAYLAPCLELCQQLGDQAKESRVHDMFSLVSSGQGHHADAIVHELKCLAFARSTGDRANEAVALNNIGLNHARLGDLERGRSFCQQALALNREAGNLIEAATWDSLGYIEHKLGRYAEAADCYHHALTLYRGQQHRYYEADTLDHLGDTHDAAGKPHQAHDAWQQALDILNDLRHPGADQVRAKL